MRARQLEPAASKAEMREPASLRVKRHRLASWPRIVLLLAATAGSLASCQRCTDSKALADAQPFIDKADLRPALVVIRPDLSEVAKDCSRGEPEPILQPTAKFTPAFEKLGSLEAQETVELAPALQVRIRQAGCANAVEEITFRLTAAELEATQKYTPQQWLRKAASLVEQLPAVSGYQSVLKLIVHHLQAQATARAPYQLGTPIQVSENETLTLSVKVTSAAAEVTLARIVAL